MFSSCVYNSINKKSLRKKLCLWTAILHDNLKTYIRKNHRKELKKTWFHPVTWNNPKWRTYYYLHLRYLRNKGTKYILQDVIRKLNIYQRSIFKKFADYKSLKSPHPLPAVGKCCCISSRVLAFIKHHRHLFFSVLFKSSILIDERPPATRTERAGRLPDAAGTKRPAVRASARGGCGRPLAGGPHPRSPHRGASERARPPPAARSAPLRAARSEPGRAADGEPGRPRRLHRAHPRAARGLRGVNPEVHGPAGRGAGERAGGRAAGCGAPSRTATRRGTCHSRRAGPRRPSRARAAPPGSARRCSRAGPAPARTPAPRAAHLRGLMVAPPGGLSLPEGARPQGTRESRGSGVVRAAWARASRPEPCVRRRLAHTCPPPLPAASLAARAQRARLNLPFIPGPGVRAPPPRDSARRVPRRGHAPPPPNRRRPPRRVLGAYERARAARPRCPPGGCERGPRPFLLASVARPVGCTEHERWRQPALASSAPRSVRWTTGWVSHRRAAGAAASDA